MKRIVFLIISVLAVLASCNAPSPNTGNTVDTVNGSITIDVPAEYADKNIDKVSVEAFLVNDANLRIKRYYEEHTIQNPTEVVFSPDTYGYFDIWVNLYFEGSLVGTLMTEAALTADEYNIALLSATVPVTYTSLYLADEDLSGSPLISSAHPTIIALERSDAFDWSSLGKGMMACPFFEDGAYQSGIRNNVEWSAMIDGFSRYVGYLHKLNPSSKFNFIFNDFDSYLLLPLAFDNGLTSSDQFSVTLISDGTGTYGTFRETFGTGGDGDDSLARFEELSAKWNEIRRKSFIGDKDGYDSVAIGHRPIAHIQRHLVEFAPILACDDSLDITWIVNRNNADTFGNSQAYNTYIKDNVNIDVINMYNIMAELNADERESFRNLYSLQLDEFEQAEREGKRAMIFLGTSAEFENSLEEFLTIMKNLYPEDQWAYLYKAHPGNAYQSSRSAMLDRMGVSEIDPSVPAEIYCFFESDAVTCGYGTSTYDNIENEVAFVCAVADSIPGNASGKRQYAVLYKDGEYQITDEKKDKFCIWDPSQPDVFNWQ